MAIQKLLKAGSADAGAIKQTNSTVSTPKKSGTDSTKTSTTLSGNKNFQFAGVTNSTLSASLKKTSGLKKTGEVVDSQSKTGVTGYAPKDIEDSSLFESAFKEGTNKAGNLLQTLTDVSNATQIFANPSSIDYARQSYQTADMLLNIANNLAANSNWSGAQSVLEQALQEIKNAETEVKKAGSKDSSLETSIAAKKSAIEAAYNRAKTNASKSNSDSKTEASSCGGSCGSGGGCSGGGSATPAAAAVPATTATQSSTPLTDMVGATTEAFKNIKDGLASLFGGGKSDATGKTSSSSPSTGKSDELKYDRNSAVAKDIKDNVEPRYNKASETIKDCNDKIAVEKANVESADKDIKVIKGKIDALDGEQSEELLQDYNKLQADASKKNDEYNKQDQLSQKHKAESDKLQREITKQDGVVGQKKTAHETAVSNQKATAEKVTSTAKAVKEAQATLDNTERYEKDAEGNNTNVETQAYKDALKARDDAKTAAAAAEQENEKAEKEVQNAKAELDRANNDLKALKDAKETSDKEVEKAENAKTKLQKEKDEINNQLSSKKDAMSKLKGDLKTLKDGLDTAYDKKNAALAKIAEYEAQIDIAKTEQGLAQQQAKNIEQEHKDKNADNASFMTKLARKV